MSCADDQGQSEKSVSAETHQSDELNTIDAARHDRIVRATEMLLARRLRQATFGHKLAEPAWDMMVALYVADTRDQEMTASSLSMQTDVPPSTALRWIHCLVADGYVAEIPSLPASAGRVRLLPKARELLDTYFAALPVSSRSGKTG